MPQGSFDITAKQTGVGASAFLATIILYVISLIWPDHPVPPEVAAAFAGFMAFAGGYCVRELDKYLPPPETQPPTPTP